MPRIPRLLIPDTPTVFHVMSKTALPDYPIQHFEKEFLFNLIRKLSRIYFCDVLDVCIMSNHFHLPVRMHPSGTYADNEVTNRFDIYYGGKREMTSNQIPFYKKNGPIFQSSSKRLSKHFQNFIINNTTESDISGMTDSKVSLKNQPGTYYNLVI